MFAFLICVLSIHLLDNSWLIILLLLPINRNQIKCLLFTSWTDWGKTKKKKKSLLDWLRVPYSTNNAVIQINLKHAFYHRAQITQDKYLKCISSMLFEAAWHRFCLLSTTLL